MITRFKAVFVAFVVAALAASVVTNAHASTSRYELESQIHGNAGR